MTDTELADNLELIIKDIESFKHELPEDLLEVFEETKQLYFEQSEELYGKMKDYLKESSTYTDHLRLRIKFRKYHSDIQDRAITLLVNDREIQSTHNNNYIYPGPTLRYKSEEPADKS